MKRLFNFALFLAILASFTALSASAHAGKTDSNGGHWDHSTGEYHYHHGYPAHSHYDMDDDGSIDCPYEFDDKTGQNSGQSNGGSSGGTSHRNPTSTTSPTVPTTVPTAPTTEHISIPAGSPTNDTTVEPQDNVAPHISDAKSSKEKFDFETFVFSWQHFAVSLLAAAIAVLFAKLSSYLENKGHRFISKIFLALFIVLGISSIPGVLLIAMFLYVAWSIIALLWYLVSSVFKWVASKIARIFCKKSKNKNVITRRIEAPEVIDTPALSSDPSDKLPVRIAYSNGNRAYDVCKFMWVRSQIFCNQLQPSSSMQAKTYLWTSFFYATAKFIRKQAIVDEIYTEFLSAVESVMEKDNHSADTLENIRSDYHYLRKILNASDIDPRIIDGIDELWTITASFAFPGRSLPDNARFGFRFNVNLLVNHAMIKYQLKKPETIYYLEAKNGMTVRVPESKLKSWTEAQESGNPQMSEEQRKALAARIVSDIYHSKTE